MPESADKFFWGATVNAHAVEGRDFDSDWWRWEQRPTRIAGGGTSEIAADHLGRYHHDINLAGKTGLNGLHYAISWARIEPRQGAFDEEALEHYRDVFAAMCAKGITPIAVLNEFALPAWFASRGAWDHPHAAQWFKVYLERVYDALGTHCRHWIPVSDPQLWQRMAFGERRWPRPARAGRFPRDGIRAVIALHQEAQAYLAGQDGRNAVGLSIAAPALYPADPHSPWDRRAAGWQRHLRERYLPMALAGACDGALPCDFIALSLPGRHYIHFAPGQPRNLLAQYETTPGTPGSADSGTPDPAALPAALERAAQWGLPVLVIGGGVADDDHARCRYLLDHAHEILRARSRGTRVMGFCYGPLLDGFAGRYGYTRRYGLVHVDRKTLARTPNPSAFLFQDIARHEAIRPGAVARYCPDWHEPVREAC